MVWQVISLASASHRFSVYVAAGLLLFSLPALAVRHEIQELVQSVYGDAVRREGRVLNGSEPQDAAGEADGKTAPVCRVSGWAWERLEFGEAPHKKFSKYAFMYNVTCTSDASVKIFFSGATDPGSKTDGLGGIYRDLELKQGNNTLEPLELTTIDATFGTKAAMQWVHIQATNAKGSTTREYFQDVEQVEGVDGKLWFTGGNHKDGCYAKRWTHSWGPKNGEELKKFQLRVAIVCPTASHVKVFFSSPLHTLEDPVEDNGVTGVWKEADVPADTETYMELVDLLHISNDLVYGLDKQTMWISIRADGNRETNDYINVLKVPGERTVRKPPA